MNKSYITLSLFVLLVCTGGSSYNHANATTLRIYCPSPDPAKNEIKYAQGEYEGTIDIDIVSEGNHQYVPVAVREKAKGTISFEGMQHHYDHNLPDKVMLSCDYNLAITHVHRVPLTFKLPLDLGPGNEKLAESCKIHGCTHQPDTTSCHVYCSAPGATQTPKPR